LPYLGKGFYFGIFRDGADVYRRWNEERFLLGGLANPRMAAGFARRGVVYPFVVLFFRDRSVLGLHGRRC